MNNFFKLLKGGKYKIIEGGSVENKRYVTLISDNGVELNIAFLPDEQKVLDSFLYVKSLNKFFRWIEPDYINEYKDICFKNNIDPRIASNNTNYIDCDIFDDYLEKVEASFNTGTCDDTVLMNIELTEDEKKFFISMLKPGQTIEDLFVFWLEKIAKEYSQKMEKIGRAHV